MSPHQLMSLRLAHLRTIYDGLQAHILRFKT